MPAGTPQGGQFTSAQGAGQADSDDISDDFASSVDDALTDSYADAISDGMTGPSRLGQGTQVAAGGGTTVDGHDPDHPWETPSTMVFAPFPIFTPLGAATEGAAAEDTAVSGTGTTAESATAANSNAVATDTSAAQSFGKLGTVAEDPKISITSLTDYAAERASSRGVSLDTIANTVSNPSVVLQQSSGRYLFISNDAAVVVNPTSGKVITTYPSALFDDAIKQVLAMKK